MNPRLIVLLVLCILTSAQYEPPPIVKNNSTSPPSEEGGSDAVEAEKSSSTTDELPETPGTDVHEHCCWWAQEGECDSNPYWMRPRCQKSCGTYECTVENAGGCAVILDVDDCRWKREGGPIEPETTEMPEFEKFGESIGGCENKHRLCNFWQNRGQCEANAAWMDTNCAVACGKC